MKFLFVGDVVGRCGCNALAKTLCALKCEYKADAVIVNGENSADNNGISLDSAQRIFDAGADVITLGNHAFQRSEILEELERNKRIIRPANYGGDAAGQGVCYLDFGGCKAAVINLVGFAFMPPCDNPFKCVDALLKEIDANMIIVDFHAEATAEKRAMGCFLEGRVSAVLGTHTHVQTADERITCGTAYITDVGMAGAYDSVIGIEKGVALDRFCSYIHRKNAFAKGEAEVCGVYLDIEDKSGKCRAIERFKKIIS